MAWYDPRTWFKKEPQVTVIDTSPKVVSYRPDSSGKYKEEVVSEPKKTIVYTGSPSRSSSSRSSKRSKSSRDSSKLQSSDVSSSSVSQEIDTGTNVTSPTNQIKDISPPTQDKNLIHKIYTGVANTFAPAKDYISSKFDKGSSAVKDIKEKVGGFNERYKYETTGGKIKKAYEEIDTNVYGGYLPGGDSPSDVRAKSKAKGGYKDYIETTNELKDKSIYDIHREVTDYDIKRDYFTWRGTAYDSKALKDVFEEKSNEEIQRIMTENITPQINENVKNAQERLNFESENINNLYYSGKITLEERNRRVENLERKTNVSLANENEKIAENIANRWWSNNEENLTKRFSLAGRDILNMNKLKNFNIKTVASSVAAGVVTGGAVTGAVGLGVISASAVKATAIPLTGLGLGITGAGVVKELYDKKQTKDYIETTNELKDKSIYDIHREVTDYDIKRDYFTWRGTAYDSKALKDVFEEKSNEEIQRIMTENITPQINENVKNAQERLNFESENINNLYYSGKITLEERNRRVENLERKTNVSLANENEKIAENIANRWWSNNEENLTKRFSLAGRDILNMNKLKNFNIKTVASSVAAGVVTGGAVTGAVGLGVISASAVKATAIPLTGLGLGITGVGVGKELYDKKQTYGEVTGLDVASSLLPTTLKIGAGVGGAIAGSFLVGGITTNLNAKNEAKFLKDHKTEINTIKNKLVRDENFLNKHLKVDGKNTYAEIKVAGKPVKFNVNVKSPSWQRTKLLREGDPSTIIKTTSVGGSQKEQMLVSFKDSIGKGVRHQDISVGKIDSNIVSRITGQNIKGEDWYSITSKINVAGKTQPVSYIFKWTPSKGITNVQVASLDMVSSSQGYLFTSKLNPTRLITGTSNVKGSPPLKIESLSIDRNLNVFRVDVKSTSSKEGAVTLTKTDNLLWDIKNPIIDTRSSITGVKWSGSKNEMPLTEFLSSNRGLIYDKSSLSPFRTGSSLRITADAGSKVYIADVAGAKVGSKVTDSIFFEKSISQSITHPPIKITTATSSRTPPSIMEGSSGTGSSSSFAGGSSGTGSTSLIKSDSTSLITPNFQESILGMAVPSPKIFSPKITTSITPPKIVDSSFRFSQFVIPQTDIKQDSSLISSASITPRVESKRIIAPNLELNNLLGGRNIQKPQYSQVNKSIISPDTTTPPLIETPVISPTTPPISKPKIDFNYGGLPFGWGLGEIKTGGGKRASPSKSLFGGKTTYTPSLGSVLLRTPSKKVTKEEAVKLSEKRYSGIGLRPIIKIEEDNKNKKKMRNSLF
jgi:hypothetical protein